MQLKKSKTINLTLKSISLPVAILLATSNGSVNADTIFRQENQDRKSREYISQNREQREQPPEVIIDTNPIPFPQDRNRDTNRDRDLNRDRDTNRDWDLNRDRNTNRDRRSRTTADVRFKCEYFRGEYTVMYTPQSQPDSPYPWAVPSRMGGGWTPQRRCEEIARRLELYRPDGLDELRTGVENGYQVLCATTQRDPRCRIVLTVPPGEDARQVRDRVFENLVLANDGQQTDGVYTFTDNNSNNDVFSKLGELLEGRRSPSRRNTNRSGDINLRPFLDRYDGGTSERL